MMEVMAVRAKVPRPADIRAADAGPGRTTRPAPATGVLQRCGGRSCPPGTCNHSGAQARAPVPSAVHLGRVNIMGEPSAPDAVDALVAHVRTLRGDMPVPSAHSAVQDGGGHPARSSVAPPLVADVLRSAGHPLDGATRSRMEHRFSHDFGRVRVHTDERAAKSARAVGALAYTVGSDVVLGTDRYTHGSSDGERVLAHELAHVVQQENAAGFVRQATALHIGADADALEREAHAASERVAAGRGVRIAGRVSAAGMQRQAFGPFLTNKAAGGCGICYRGDVRAAGTDVHEQIQNLMTVMYRPFMISNAVITTPNSPYILKAGTPDLLLITETGVKVGEIKPANKEGYLEGAAKIEIYLRLLEQKFGKIPGFTVQPLDVDPPRPFPFFEEASLTCTQMVWVSRPVRGVYAYLCVPPFSALRRVCRCRGDREPVPVPVPRRQESEADAKERARRRQTAEPDIAVPPELVPVGLAALLAAAAAWFARKAPGRLLALAMVFTALVLVANGAEASVGLHGDDAFEAMAKLAARRGTPIPDDLKEAVKRDPALRRILDEAAASGDATEAQRRLGEQLTRTVLENRDAFTDEELRELLRVTEEHREVISDSAPTVEALQRSLDARPPNAVPPAAAGGGGAGPPAPAPGRPPQQPAATDVGPQLTGPARRLFETLTGPGSKGPRLGEAKLAELRRIITEVEPPLTDAEAEILIPRITSAEGRTADEVLDSVRRGIGSLRGSKAGGTAAAGAAADVNQAEDRPPVAGQTSRDPHLTRTKPQPGAKRDSRTRAKLERSWGHLRRGDWVLLGPAELTLRNGLKVRGTLVGRDTDTGSLCLGTGTVTARESDGSWVFDVPEGIPLYSDIGLFGKTRKMTMPSMAGPRPHQ